MTTTNPINMSVLPTEQCLIEDGASNFSVAGQFTPASSFVDSYQLCEPNGKCLSVGAAAGAITVAAAIAELAARAKELVGSKQYSEAAGAYMELGRALEASDEPHNAVDAVRAFNEAGKLHRATNDVPNSAHAFSAAARTARKIGMETAFSLIALAADTYLEVATTGTREERFLRFENARRLLRDQAELLSVDGRGSDMSPSDTVQKLTHELVVEICVKRIVAISGAKVNNPLPAFGENGTAGMSAYYTAQAELADVYERLGDAHAALENLGEASVAYMRKHIHLREAPDARLTLQLDERQGDVEAFIAHLARDHDGRMDHVVRNLSRLFNGRESQFTNLLDDENSWLSKILRRHLREEIVPVFKSRARAAFEAKIK